MVEERNLSGTNIKFFKLFETAAWNREHFGHNAAKKSVM